MARTDMDRAADAVYELYNVAEHVGRLATAANTAMAEGNAAWAKRVLDDAKRSAEMFDYRWREAMAALEAVTSTPTT